MASIYLGMNLDGRREFFKKEGSVRISITYASRYNILFTQILNRNFHEDLIDFKRCVISYFFNLYEV